MPESNQLYRQADFGHIHYKFLFYYSALVRNLYRQMPSRD
jgi:hypothetical protein